MKMRLGRRHGLPLRVLIVLLIVGVLCLFETYRFVMPFVARNPMYHDATIGESVINGWRYSGEDAEGYLRFYDKSTGQTALLPPNSKLFGADGQFVVIEEATPGSITYASPLESAPPIWYVLMAGVVGGAIWLMIFRVKRMRTKRMHLRSQSSHSPISSLQINGRPRRFRARKKPPRFFR